MTGVVEALAADHAQLKKLLEPFPPEAIGQLPKGGVMLDYVGHAATTKRLLEVDPEWTWEPLALDEVGLPAYDAKGGLWIRLTICGVTRLGYGDGPDPKQRIGDAIRNAAMRFGVALDLWAKEDISETLAQPVERSIAEVAAAAAVMERWRVLPDEYATKLGEHLRKHDLRLEDEVFNPAFVRLLAKAEEKAAAERPFEEVPS